jgi:hypothetical protein
METIGKAIKTQNGYKFIKEFYGQGHVYKYLGDLDLIDDNYPIYQSEHQEGDYETKATLKKLCKGSKVNWEFLFDMLDWAGAEATFECLNENID